MIQTILIPTDFSIRSLQVVKHVLACNPDVRLNVVHATGIRMTDSITNLLFFSRKDLAKKLASGVFSEACQVIRNKYVTQINEMRVEVFTGATQGAFNLFTDGQKIDRIYLPENKLAFKHRRFDLIPFMLESKLPKEIVAWEEFGEVTTQNHMTDLFENWA